MTINKNIIRVGSRKSPLALIQVEEIQKLCTKKIFCTLKHKTFITEGDKDKNTSLVDKNIKDDFFTDSLDSAVLKKDIDVAIHSAKDLPQKIHQDLSIFALTPAIDATDAFVGNQPLKDLPKGSKVGTSSVIRQKATKALNPLVETIDIRGTIEERIHKMQNGICDGLIIATIALKRLGLEKHIQEIMPWETTPLQGQLAIVGRKDNDNLRKLFQTIDVRRSYGKVILVGAGPGDPDLITQKGVKALQQAECVFYDYLVSKDLLQYAPHAEHIYVGKRKGVHSLPQAELSKLLKERAINGQRVVRLKGGDPFIFGRGAEELAYLVSYHINVETVPGISSATALPTLLGIPLTARGISASVSFISGHRAQGMESCEIQIPNTETIVFFMGLTKLESIVAALKKAGWPDQSAIMLISKATHSDEKIVYGTLSDIHAKVLQNNLKAPALIIAGEVVKYGRSLHRN